MAGYGGLISAPLNHYMVGALQKAFEGKVGAKWRLAQLLANNVLVAPITTAGEHVAITQRAGDTDSNL
jgi:hypothetical protein